MTALIWTWDNDIDKCHFANDVFNPFVNGYGSVWLTMCLSFLPFSLFPSFLHVSCLGVDVSLHQVRQSFTPTYTCIHSYGIYSDILVNCPHTETMDHNMGDCDFPLPSVTYKLTKPTITGDWNWQWLVVHIKFLNWISWFWGDIIANKISHEESCNSTSRCTYYFRHLLVWLEIYNLNKLYIGIVWWIM